MERKKHVTKALLIVRTLVPIFYVHSTFQALCWVQYVAQLKLDQWTTQSMIIKYQKVVTADQKLL